MGWAGFPIDLFGIAGAEISDMYRPGAVADITTVTALKVQSVAYPKLVQFTLKTLITGCSGLTDCSARSWDRITLWAVVYIVKTTVIYSLGHGLCTPFLQCVDQLGLLPSMGR